MTKFLILSLMISFGCGKDKQLTDRKLERLSTVTTAGSLEVSQEGILQRKSQDLINDQIVMNGRTFLIGNSSALAYDFISSKAEGGEYPVRFKGHIVGKEIEITEMSDK